MARAATNRMRDICAKIRRTVAEDPTTPTVMRTLGEFAIVLIVKRTRLGFGTPDGGNGAGERFTLKPLADTTIDARKRMGRRGTLSDVTSPKRSNLTATGQMLDSMAVTAVSSTTVSVAPTGSRQGGGPSNAEVAAYVSEQGRSFLQLSRLEADQLTRFYRNIFGDLLRNTRIV